MIGKVNSSQVYMPGNSKQHVYYPIEPKRNPSTQVQQPPPQSSFSFERTTGHRIERIKQKQIDLLRKNNEELKEREEIYIQKLMKLEQGLQNQHRQFIKLQELYTELFESYKQKQMEVAELETKFRQSDRYRETDRRQTNRSREQEVYSAQLKNYEEEDKETSHRERQPDDGNREKQWLEKEWLEKEWLEKEKEWTSKQHEYITMIDSLNLKLLKVNENHDRVVQQMYYMKSKDKLSESKAALTQKTIQQLQMWQNQVDNQKQTRMKYQYQNQFLKSRNNDLQAQREQLQKLLAYKQKEIIKLREDKIRIHRQSSEKVMQRSPSKGTQSRYNLRNVVAMTEHKQMQVASDKQKNNQSNSVEEVSQNQYFSFSRSKNNNSVDSELPNFPAELQIDQLINVHRK